MQHSLFWKLYALLGSSLLQETIKYHFQGVIKLGICLHMWENLISIKFFPRKWKLQKKGIPSLVIFFWDSEQLNSHDTMNSIETVSRMLVEECKSWQLKVQKAGVGTVRQNHFWVYYEVSHCTLFLTCFNRLCSTVSKKSHCTFALILLHSAQYVATVCHKYTMLFVGKWWV